MILTLNCSLLLSQSGLKFYKIGLSFFQRSSDHFPLFLKLLAFGNLLVNLALDFLLEYQIHELMLVSF